MTVTKQHVGHKRPTTKRSGQGKPKLSVGINKTKLRKNDLYKKVKNIPSVRNSVLRDPVFVNSIQPVLSLGYKFIKILGRGSEGFVFLAEDLTRGGHVAIKTLDMKRRTFIRTARNDMGLGEFSYWSHLHHPNLMKLIEKVAYPDHVYYVMEYTANDTLLDFVRCYRPRNEATIQIDARLMIRWARDLLRAVQYLHKRGLCHLDIKPDNIFLDGDWDLRLGDFGYMRATKDTTRVITLGCLAYWPPEALTKKNLSGISLEKVDIWMTGVTILEMLTGRIISGKNFYIGCEKQNTVLKNIIDNLPRLKKMDMDCKGGKDLVISLLQWNPNCRPSASVALSHPWLH